MKLRKIITMGLAAIMAVSAMSISAFAADYEVCEIEESGIVYTGDPNEYNNINYAVFVEEKGEIKQITPIETDIDIDNVSVSINNESIIVTDSDGNVVQTSPIQYEINSNVARGLTYQKYRVTGNNVNMWNSYARDYVVLTLELGTSFWSNRELMGYREGYVLVSGNRRYGVVSGQYLTPTV